MTEPALRAARLGHAYRPGQWLFRSLEFSLPAGSSLAILAPNGRGKSTLLSALAGTLRPIEGDVVRSTTVATVPSALTTAFDYTALDMVLMGRAGHVSLLAGPSRHDETVAVAALRQFGLQARATSPFASLSSGERQLVLLARAVASESRLLLLDEPTASLDLHHQQDVARWIARLTAEGYTTVFTTHDPNHGSLASRVLLLFGGEDHLFGPSESVLTADTLGRLFGCEVVALRQEKDLRPARTFFVVPLDR